MGTEAMVRARRGSELARGKSARVIKLPDMVSGRERLQKRLNEAEGSSGRRTRCLPLEVCLLPVHWAE